MGGYKVEFIQDYVMRVIYEMVRMALKLIFNITVPEAKQQIEETQEQNERYNKLVNLINNGKINEAENLLYEAEFSGIKGDLLLGIQFYNYLNELDDEYLEKHDFSRQEVKEGLETLLIKCGYKDIICLL